MKRQRSRIQKRRTARHHQRMGAAAVEFAIVANIFLVMTFTCMEFARMNMVRNLAQDAAYFAARHAVVPGATSAEAVSEADRIMSSMITNGYSVQVSDLDSKSTEVSVTVSVDLAEVAFFAPFFLPNSTIETVANLKTERYDGFYQQ